jgi:hypothetical protein
MKGYRRKKNINVEVEFGQVEKTAEKRNNS